MNETYEEEWNDRYGGLAGYKTITSADAGESCDWDQFHVLRGPDGRLYVGAESGCSCNYFGDTRPDDLTPVDSWHDAANRAQEWAQNPEFPWHERRAGAAYELCATLARIRPPAVLDLGEQQEVSR